MRTIVLILLLTNLVCAIFMVSVWIQYHRRYKGTAYWILDMFFQTLATLLIIMRGNVPDWISIDVSNTLSIAGLILGLRGLEEFLGIRRSNVHNYILLVLFALIHIWFTFHSPDLAKRNLNLSVFSLLIFSQCSWVMLRLVPMKMRAFTRGVGIVFIYFSFVSLARILRYFVSQSNFENFFQSDLFESVVMVIYLLLIIIVTYSIVLMFSKRLLMDIKSEEEKFSIAFRTVPYGLMLARLSDGFILDVNNGFEAILGYSVEMARNDKTLGNRIWENDSYRKSVVSELIANGAVHEKEYRFRKITGGFIIGLLSARIIMVNNEECIMYTISDITERKRVEDALHSALQHLKFHESNSPLAVIEFDKDFRVTKWSKNAAKIFGWQEKEVLGKLMFEFKWVYEEDIEKVSFLSQQLLTTKNKSYKNVNRNYNKDGSVITCEWFNSALSDSEGNLISVQSLIQDITQRVNSEEKLRRSEKNLADAERISHSGSWVYDINSGNSEWSENMYNLFEIERSHPKELLFDIYLRTRVHPDDRIHLLRVFINARDGRGDFDLVYRNIKSDGRIRYIQAIAEMLRDKGNNAFRMVGKVQDITEQKISNDFLKKSEEKFRKLFENSPLGKTITTVDGLVQVNSSFCWMIGYSSEELKNIDWTKIIHPDDIKKTNDEFQILISGSSDRVRNEKRYIHKDGSIIFTDVSTYLHRGSDGKPRYFIATIIDMTERVLLERERFRLLDIIDQSINEIYLFHSDTLRFDYANSGALNNLGYTIYEIRFLTPLDIKPQFSAESFIQLIEPLRSGEKGSLVFETVHRRKNGTEYPVEVHLQLFKREEQSLFLAIISDITERIINKQRITKLNEELELRVIDRTEKLRISQQNYREIFEISPVSILKEDWEKVIREIKRIRKEEGVSDFRSYFETNPLFVQSALDSVKILDINPATMTLFGASGKHQLLKSLRVVFSAPDLIPGFVDELVALSSGMTVFESDIALRKLDNEIIYVLVRMVFPPADSENGIVL